MSLSLTIKDIEAVWEASEPERKARATRKAYYDGRHAITKSSDRYVDGSAKSKRVTNWPMYAVDRFVGALTGEPWQITRKEDTRPNAGTEWYTRLSEAQNLNAVDTESLRCALIYGFGIEVHEFRDGEVKIRNGNPLNWVLLYDSNERLRAAINRRTLPATTLHEGKLLAADTEFITYYDDRHITDYQATKDGFELAGEPKAHSYERLPIVAWRTNRERTSLISNDLMGQVDEYNEIDSMSGDDIRNDVDAMLLLRGIDPNWLQEPTNPKYPNGEKVADRIRSSKMLPLQDADSDASYLQRSTDVERVRQRLARTREHIHLTTDVPDVNTIVGATGGTSGIALRLKFMPMIHRAGTMIHYLTEGMRERVELINAVNAKFDGLQEAAPPVIEDFDVSITFSLPVNRLEEWSRIGALNGIVSRRTQLGLLSDITNVDEEIERLASEPAPIQEGVPTPESEIQRGANTVRDALGNGASLIDRTATAEIAKRIETIGPTLGANATTSSATV